MKISAFKYKLLFIFITILFVAVDIVLMSYYGFGRQFLIFIYVIIGIIPLSSIIALFSNLFVPTITIDNNAKTITSDFVANERYKSNRNFRNQGDVFYYDEIINCEIDKSKLIIKLSYGQTRTLYLRFFTKSQIEKIIIEIDKIINENVEL